MPDISIISICHLTTAISKNMAYYSHLIPIVYSLLLGCLVFFKAKKDTLSEIFLAFSIVFSLWLIGNLITWVSDSYYLVYTTWSLLVYLEILFHLLVLYFIVVFVRKSDISSFFKILLFLLILIPFFITILQKPGIGPFYPICGALNNNFLDQYKLYLEILVLAIILIYFYIPVFKKDVFYNKKSHLVVLGSTFLFLVVLGMTKYLASLTNFYELNLYSLFIIPFFLIAITYSIFKLDIFNLRIISTYFIVFGFLILTGIQLIFVSSSTDKLLTILNIIFSIFLAYIMFNNLKKESDQRIQIEILNIDLQKLIQQRESLMHLITHKVKGSFTHTKYIFAGLLDGMFGAITPEIKKMAELGRDSDDAGIKTVDLILNASNLQKGIVKYDFKPTSFKEIVLKTIEEKKEIIQKKGLEIEKNIGEENYLINGDVFWLKEVVNNLIDNALNYTSKGKVTINLQKQPARNADSIAIAGGKDKVLFSIKDTGIGITEEDKKKLFTEGGRGKESVKVNMDSTGYGLYSVKLIVEAHGGRVWAESEGAGKGSQFFIELNAI